MSGADILVRDGVAYLGIEDPELWEAVVESTSFKLVGADYRTRDNRRDKRTRMVRNKKCPVGLLDRVCRTIVLNGAAPQVTWASTQLAPKPGWPMRLRDLELRDYQEEAELAAMLNDRGIYRMPTGSGKSAVMAAILAARGLHGLIVVPTIDLLHQTRSYLTEHLDSARLGEAWGSDPLWEIGQLGDGVVNPQPVTVATIRTIAKVLNTAYESYEFAELDDTDETAVDPRALKEWVESIGVVLVDETQVLGCRTLFDVVTKIPAPCKYGMSASPWRDDGADLMIEAATGPPIYRVSAERLVREGYLMAPEFVLYDTSSWWDSAAWGSVCANCDKQWLQWTRACDCGCTTFRSQFQQAYKQEIVENEARNAKIAQIVQELDRPTLVLVKQVKHGRTLADMIPGAVFLSGRDKGEHRQAVFDQVRTGEVQVVVCTVIADQGLDLPRLEALVLAGGGKSSVRALQRVGRVVRPFPDKRRPIVVEFQDSHIHAWFERHLQKRRKILVDEWGTLAEWRFEQEI